MIRKPKYLVVFIALVLAMGAGYYLNTRAGAALFSANLDSLPKKIDSWSGEDDKLDNVIKDALNADSILSRTYTNSNGESVGLLIVYRKYGRRDFAHRPEACYPASGFDIVASSYKNIDYGNTSVRACEVIAQKEDQRDIILYFFASGDRTEANFIKQQFIMSADRLKTQKYGWAFIRFNSTVMYSDEETNKLIENFAKDIAIPLQKTLTEK
jgi:EpsI family protein